ncbi:MAG TPA: transposase [Firmicutes bacterium]|nr:transposase [Bacillota bacterium]
MNDIRSLSYTKRNGNRANPATAIRMESGKDQRGGSGAGHIRLFVEIPPKLTILGLMSYLKGKSAAMMYGQFGDLKDRNRNKEL